MRGGGSGEFVRRQGRRDRWPTSSVRLQSASRFSAGICFCTSHLSWAQRFPYFPSCFPAVVRLSLKWTQGVGREGKQEAPGEDGCTNFVRAKVTEPFACSGSPEPTSGFAILLPETRAVHQPVTRCAVLCMVPACPNEQIHPQSLLFPCFLRVGQSGVAVCVGLPEMCGTTGSAPG